MPPFFNTPGGRTEADERSQFIEAFSEMDSFAPPAGGDDLLGALANGRKNTSIHTPSARNGAMRQQRNGNAKPEFTPLLQSAARNRFNIRTGALKFGGPETPAAFKPGFHLSSPALPENSMMASDLSTVDATPIPVPESSSAMSTPIPALPKRGELGLNGDGGNVLTLKEQEAKLEKIDKENFGLKLKIHFLEENLKRTGTEYSQQTLKENSELKTNQFVLEHDLKKYRKQLDRAETELERYRIQLEEYMEKVKRRHVDEAMREEFEKLQALADQRECEIKAMQDRLNQAESNVPGSAEGGEQVELLREQIEDLQQELKDAQQTVDSKEDQIEDLQAKLRSGQGDIDEQLDKKDEELEAQAEQIEQLQQELQALKDEKSDSDNVQDALDAEKREHEAELNEIQSQLDKVERLKREQLREFESRLLAFHREKEADFESLQRKLLATEDSKASEIEALETRLKIALSQGDNQSKLSQQAAEDASNKLRIVTLEKDEEIERIQSELDQYRGIEDELDISKRQYEGAQEEMAHVQEQLTKERQSAQQLRDDLIAKEQQIRHLRNSAQDRDVTTSQVERLQLTLSERTNQISTLQKTVETQTVVIEEMKELRVHLTQMERKHQAITEQVANKQAEVDQRERQIETLRKTLQDRNDELEVLREANNEPDTQIEGLQSIMRHRDSDLQDLREQVNEQQTQLDAVQRLAEERLQALNDLRVEMDESKRDLEDEIQVLETSLDEAEDRVATLTKELQANEDAQGTNETLDRKIRTFEREKKALQATIDELQRDQEMADSERISMHSTIDKLRADLKRVQETAQTAINVSPLPKGTSVELKALRLEQQDLKSRLSKAKAALEKAQLDHEQDMEIKANQHAAEVRKLQRAIKTRDEEIRELQFDTDQHAQAGLKAQRAREEAGHLSAQVVSIEKKHVAEIKGLAKQIQVLRTRLGREKTFRDELAFQKKWFIMMIDMYDACNATNIRMIEEMGITPDPTIKKKPALKTAALSIIFCLRTKKASKRWEESNRIQQALVRKMETMRGQQPRQGRHSIR